MLKNQHKNKHVYQLEYFNCKDEIFRSLLRREIMQYQRYVWRIFSELYLQTFSRSFFFFSGFPCVLLSDIFLSLIIIIFCSVSQLLFLYQYFFYFYLLQSMNPRLVFIFGSQTYIFEELSYYDAHLHSLYTYEASPETAHTLRNISKELCI